MNRIIKFRAWLRDEYMSYSHTNKGLAYLEFDDDGSTIIGEDDGDQRYENVPVMQFTGLYDKNKKPIYEGDILHIIEEGDYGGEYYAPVSYLDNWAVFGIVLLNCREISKSKTNARVDTIWTRGFLTRALGSCVQLHEAMNFKLCEVIGNIYQNSDLVK